AAINSNSSNNKEDRVSDRNKDNREVTSNATSLTGQPVDKRVNNKGLINKKTSPVDNRVINSSGINNRTRTGISRIPISRGHHDRIRNRQWAMGNRRDT